MIIFNGKELNSNHTSVENRIVEINTPLSIDTFMDKLKNKEEINPDEVAITSYRYSPKELTMQDSKDPEPNQGTNNIYNYTFRSQASLDESLHLNYPRPLEFEMFEKYNFGQKVAAEFKVENIALTDNMDNILDKNSDSTLSYKDLVKEVKLAIGCLPTLVDEDLTYAEIKAYSKAGEQLLHPGFVISEGQPCPTKEDIEGFNKMNMYEKRVVTRGFIHPLKALRFALALKNELNPGHIFTTANYNTLFSANYRDVEKFVENVEKKDYYIPFSDEVKAKINEAFVKEFRRAPRVANEYINGLLIRDRKPYTSEQFEEMLNNYVKAFNLNSVKTIASTKSQALLSLSPLIDFSTLKAQTKEALSVYVTNDIVGDLYKKHFVEWFLKNKNTNISDLVEMIEKQRDITEFDIDKSAKEHIKIAKNKKGYEDAKRYSLDSRWDIGGKPFDFSKNEVAIRGRHVEVKQGNIVMRMLDADDYTNLTVGYDTTCCQHYGGAGSSCTHKLCSDPFSACVVIEENGIIYAQSFIWTDELKDTLVFDNVEFKGQDRLDNELSKKYLDLFYEWAKAMPYKNVHIGTGYNESMRGWGRVITYTATLPSTLARNGIYSDYHGSEYRGAEARDIKHNGEMLISRTHNKPITLSTKEDEPTKWDVLAKPDMAYSLNDYKSPIEERIAFATAYAENPTPEMQNILIHKNPKAICAMENPSREVQMYIFTTHKELIDKIKNPIPEVQYAVLVDHPKEILKMDNPPEEAINLALSSDGTLVKNFPNATDDQLLIAVTSNSTAIQYIPAERQSEALQLKAIENNPKCLQFLHNPSDNVIIEAIKQDSSMLQTIKNPSYEIKRFAIEQNPRAVLDIKAYISPDSSDQYNEELHNLWETAINQNGYLIRNCGKTFPDLRMPAIRQNPFVIGIIKQPTREEIALAVTTNPKTALFIKNDEAKAYATTLIEQTFGTDAIPHKKVYIRPTTEQEQGIALD